MTTEVVTSLHLRKHREIITRVTLTLSDIPRLSGAWPVLGNIPELARDAPAMFLRALRQYGPVFQYKFAATATVCFLEPDCIREVLVDKADAFEKGQFVEGLKPLIGNGLLSSDNALHKRQRKLAAPAFHHQRIASYAALIADYAEQTQAAWRNGDVIDVHADMMTLTLRVVGKALFDADVVGESKKVGEALTYLLHAIQARNFNPLSPPLNWPTPANRRYNAAIRQLDDTIYRIIRERRTSGEDRGDLLSMLLSAQDEDDGTGMTDAQLRDEAMTIFLAGHETTANAMSWALYLLAKNPDKCARLEAEARDVLGGRAPTFEDVRALPYALQVFKEAIRLYPPAYIFGRTSVRDVQIGNYLITAGTTVALSPYALHRRPEFFADPERFEPERFTSEREAALPKFAYLPFGGGSRVCIGNQFALMEGQLMLATFAQRVSLDLADARPIELEPLVTLRPKGGLRMRVRRYNSAA